MADQTTTEAEVFDFSNSEFTCEDLINALNEMVYEYRKLSQIFEEIKAKNKGLKNSSVESSNAQLEDTDSLNTELNLINALNVMVYEYRNLSHTFEEIKAKNKGLKNSSVESSNAQLEDTDSLNTELTDPQPDLDTPQDNAQEDLTGNPVVIDLTNVDPMQEQISSSVPAAGVGSTVAQVDTQADPAVHQLPDQIQMPIGAKRCRFERWSDVALLEVMRHRIVFSEVELDRGICFMGVNSFELLREEVNDG
ncbi:hypothetical protein F511_23988 [Dorcoceras hygrometricum]|uniref:Uncharacterized protein n=1 Tax=Dorcoceras hygrometricum TaxID=472368 RepID=A0A2Z7DKL4_9LAMI|nr:hypothetical protein F511_23988 [Dorcoceras hygrometricum]